MLFGRFGLAVGLIERGGVLLRALARVQLDRHVRAALGIVVLHRHGAVTFLDTVEVGLDEVGLLPQGLAVGAALAARYQKTGAISVVFFGDGASNRGTFHEAANMAAAWHLPVIFVCENNGIACSTPHKTGGQQAVMDLSKRALGYGMDSYVVNGNDFFEVYDGMERLAKRARNGEGNCCGFLECQTHRPFGHIVGDGQRYRDPALAKARWEADDCIKNFERRCLKSGWLEQADFDAVQTKVDAMIEEAKQFAIDSPYPDASELFTDMYD